MVGYATPKQLNCVMILDSETKAVELPEDHGEEIRLWLRLLTCTTLIEGEVRGRLRQRFPSYNELANAVLRAIDIPMPEIGRASCRERVYHPV